MKAPGRPENEAARLRALLDLDILDTPPEQEFDGLTKLASTVLQTPIALVSLVDADRQWFKSRYGLEVSETSRAVSLCGHVVELDEALIVPDTWADARFSDNPLVLGAPHIRFYAGEPLRTQEGLVLGTLCAIDSRPRELTESQRASLGLLAKQVMTVLELRRRTRLLAKKQEEVAVFQQFFFQGQDLKWASGLATGRREYNPRWLSLLGWTEEELQAMPVLSLVHPEDRAATQRDFEQLVAHEGSAAQLESRYRRKDGEYLWISWAAQVVGGTIFASGRDITEGKVHEQQLRDRDRAVASQAAQLQALFAGMAEGVVLQDPQGMIITHNAAAIQILGLTSDELTGRTSMDPRWGAIREDGTPFPGDQHPAMRTVKTGEPLTDVVMGIRHPSGPTTWISINSRPVMADPSAGPSAVITTFRDITAQRLAAERATQIAQQERLITTGTLAAGVGHEINNPLSYMVMNLEHALEELRTIAGGSPSGRMRDLIEALTEARQGADRVRRIVRGLRALGREDGPPAPTDLARVVDVSLHIAMHELKHQAKLEVDLDDVSSVLADEPRLTQVLVNLLVNAGQAFVTSDPSVNRVWVTARRAGGRATISISDNGPGIPATVLPRIFDPFFTTKPLGVGTGLGLSISSSIVLALGGRLSCTSIEGQGATFRIELPLADAVSTSAPTRRRPRSSPRGRRSSLSTTSLHRSDPRCGYCVRSLMQSGSRMLVKPGSCSRLGDVSTSCSATS